MNKLLTLLLVILTATGVHAQKIKVTTASTLLGSGDILGAKNAIDEAFSDPDVALMAKAWITKGQVYNDIYKYQMALEMGVKEPLMVALESFKKAYEVDMADPKKPGKYSAEIRDGAFNTAIGLFEDAAAKFNLQEFERSMKYFENSASLISFLEEKNIAEGLVEDAFAIKRDAYQNAALCALNLADYDKAATYYEGMIESGNGTESAYANLASIYISKGMFDEAKAVIETGLQKYPDNESLKESELNYYIGSDKSELAIEKLEKAIASNPNNPDLYFNLALAYDKLGDKDKMVETYEKVLKIDPSYHGAYLNLGAYYNEKANDIIKTMNDMPDWREAIKLEPQRNEWYNKALPYLEKAHELMPDDQNVTKALERIYANLNMLDKAKELRGE